MSAAATLSVALLSAGKLSDAPVRGRTPGPDPLGSIASLVALAIGLVAFLWLGTVIARDAAHHRPALVAGGTAGALAGLAGGTGQAAALAGYLGAVLAGYAVPPEFLPIALATYVVLATVGATVLGAAITYVGWQRARTRSVSR